MFRKKTLNVNDDFNIKHDDDDIENVDEYWSTAVSVIDDDSVSDLLEEEKSSETLFNINNIRKSIQGDRKIPEEAVEASEEIINHESKDELEKDNNLKSNNLKNNNNPGNNTEMDLKKAIIKRVFTQEDDSELTRISGNSKYENDEMSKMDDTAISATCGDFSIDSAPQTNNFPTFEIDEEIKENLTNKEEKEDNEMVLKSFRNKTSKKKANNDSSHADTLERIPVSAHRPKKQKTSYSFEIETTTAVRKNNTVVPLICAPSIDVATMTFDYLAYVDSYKTENAFSIYVLKGKIELAVNDQMKMASKGSVSTVEKGDICSINCISKNGAVLLLTYAL